jgi:CRP/FNR family transcriptional regulator, cyclic AMP receptor protein
MNSSMDVNKPKIECDFDQNLAMLRSIPFLSGLGTEALKALAYLCKRMQYQTGDMLFEQGESDTQAYCLVSGSLQVLRDDGQGEVVVCNLEPGAFVGSMSLVTQTKRLFSLRASSPSICLILSQKHFLAYLSKSPEFAVALFKALYRSMLQWEEKLLSRPEWRILLKEGQFLGITLI